MKFFQFSLIVICITYPLTILQASNNQQARFGNGPTEFVIVIPSYKNEKWARENLHSACTQKCSQPYQVICIDDCSPDKTGEIMDAYVKEHHLESMVQVIHNKERVGAITNWYNTIHNYIPDHKVVVNLDGDDFLLNDTVLLTLEKYYQDPDVWLTYGSALSYPDEDWEISEQIPDRVFKENKIRQHDFVSSHLRTFKAGLFKKIKKEDLMAEGDLACDRAFMFPMLEMCAPAEGSEINHSRYVPEFLYYYRTDNPLNVFRVNKNAEIDAANRIAGMKPYAPLDNPSYTYRSKLPALTAYIVNKYS